MSHDSALQAHEHSEHARHAAHTGDVFISRIAISVAVLAVLAAVSSSLETVEGGRALNYTSEAVLEQDKATDAWAEYQADSLKKHIYGVAADGGGPHAERYRKLVQENIDKQSGIHKSAAHEERHHWLTGAATLFEIGIAMSTVAIITRRHWLWFTALGFGAVGIVLLTAAYLF
jgi:hypothetical protein